MFRIRWDPSSGSISVCFWCEELRTTVTCYSSSQLVATGTHTTGPNFTLPNTDYAHKTSQVISVKHVQYSLRMDPKGSETCRSF